MDLKKRLIITNAGIIVIPLLITVAAAFIYLWAANVIMKENIKPGDISGIIQAGNRLDYAEKMILAMDPEATPGDTYNKYAAAVLEKSNGQIAVLDDGNIVFSSIDIGPIDAEKCLQATLNGAKGTVEIGGGLYLADTFELASHGPGADRSASGPATPQDGSARKVILLYRLGEVKPANNIFLIFLLIVFVISILITNIIISKYLSTNILHPLASLKAAAVEISRGNLESVVAEEGDEEFRELCSTFEQMRLKLRESIQMQLKYDENRKMLISSISHDLKTPMTSIEGYVEGILDKVADTPEKVEFYLRTIYSKAIQVDSMIDDLLLYSKLDLKQMPFNFEKTNMIKFFEDCVFENQIELRKLNIEIKLENGIQGSGLVMLDRDNMRRVIANIISNAAKYMDKERGEIRIMLRETRSSLITEVHDNGAGIGRDDLPHIFDRFFRADSSRNEVNGSGLGLAIARQIVEGHGGSIWASSTKGEGTSIIISLRKCI